MTPFLETERLVLRQFTVDDADLLLELNSDPEVTRYTGSAGKRFDLTEIRTQLLPRYLAYYERYGHFGVWAALSKPSHEFMGWFLFRPIRDAAYFDPALFQPDALELGYRLKRSAWGQGYATEGAAALLARGLAMPEVKQVVAVVMAANVASVRVLQKIGMNLLGKRFDEGVGAEVLAFSLARNGVI